MPPLTILPFLQSVPLATRAITALYLAVTVPALIWHAIYPRDPYGASTLHSLDWLLLVPETSWKYPWTLFTAGLAVISAISLPLACRYLERVWGPRELIRFCILVIVGSNIIAFGFSWLMFFVTGKEEDTIYGTPYHGLSGLQVAFLVAFTQLIPEHQVQLLGTIKVRVKSLPGIHLLISNILVILLDPSPYMLIQFGFFVGWVYLRFFKLAEGGEFRGDRSETFAFQYWFPPPVRPYISIAANKVFALSTKIGLVQPWEEPAGSYGLLPGPGGPGGAGNARAEAERRRAMALKALDARLASSPSPAPTPAPAPSSSSTSTSNPSNSTKPTPEGAASASSSTSTSTLPTAPPAAMVAASTSATTATASSGGGGGGGKKDGKD
ncbi:hypothetical protein I350_06193 [Cryptococcus amylolentus CBS 6273]|uniref:Uncharacterized protein n=1 Tax=Cryptococcus amylolentus CBS 6273 TaxID=1296118 RepID=A0A1E3JKH9_9TREE|nr:hypothetical protein I350_06193 [Cryptococcus amylolentus CBS 6273]